MTRNQFTCLGRTWRALAIVAPMLACTGRDVRQSDSAPSMLPLAVDTAAAAHPVAAAPLAGALACVVTDSGIGPIRLGMTFAEAKQALPAAEFEHTSDGDGAVLVGVTVGRHALMALFAEDDEEGPIHWEKRISGMETFSPLCSTTDGVHPQSLVLDAEKVLGKTRKIILSEIESRQFIEFERQRPGMTLRLDYTGIFAAGSRETQRFEPEGKILSIALWAH